MAADWISSGSVVPIAGAKDLVVTALISEALSSSHELTGLGAESIRFANSCSIRNSCSDSRAAKRTDSDVSFMVGPFGGSVDGTSDSIRHGLAARIRLARSSRVISVSSIGLLLQPSGWFRSLRGRFYSLSSRPAALHVGTVRLSGRGVIVNR